jgi:hypothetical protein
MKTLTDIPELHDFVVKAYIRPYLIPKPEKGKKEQNRVMDEWGGAHR